MSSGERRFSLLGTLLGVNSVVRMAKAFVEYGGKRSLSSSRRGRSTQFLAQGNESPYRAESPFSVKGVLGLRKAA